MRAKTKFLKMYYKLPEKARHELIYDAYGSNPMGLAVVAEEVRYDTDMGKKVLSELGFEDD